MKVYFIVLHVILPLFFPFKLCMLVFLSLFVLVSIICCIIFFFVKIMLFSFNLSGGVGQKNFPRPCTKSFQRAIVEARWE